MQQYTLVLFGLAILNSSALMINCPSNMQHLCYVLEDAETEEKGPQAQYRILLGRNTESLTDSLDPIVDPIVDPIYERDANPSANRQDVDHALLRFGRDMLRFRL